MRYPHWGGWSIPPPHQEGTGYLPIREDGSTPLLGRVGVALTPPSARWGHPPPPAKYGQRFPSINISFPRTSYVGGKNGGQPVSKDVRISGLPCIAVVSHHADCWFRHWGLEFLGLWVTISPKCIAFGIWVQITFHLMWFLVAQRLNLLRRVIHKVVYNYDFM